MFCLEVKKLILKVNGKEHRVSHNINVFSLLQDLYSSNLACIVEVNGQMVRKAQWSETWLKDQDSIEILRLVGGG